METLKSKLPPSVCALAVATAVLVQNPPPARGILRMQAVKCPVCGHEFSIVYTASYTVMFIPRYSRDLQKFGSGPPVYEQCRACPKCFFSGTRQEFSQKLASAVRAKVIKHFRPKARRLRGRMPDAAMACAHAARIYQWQKKKNRRIAHAYRLASYILRGTTGKDDLRRKNMQRLAAAWYIKALKAGEFKPPKTAEIKYLVGEFLRRTGSFSKALQWFARAQKEMKPSHRLYTILRQQIRMAARRDANNNI